MGLGMEMNQILDQDNSSVIFSNTSSNFSLVELVALREVIKPLSTLPWFCKVSFCRIMSFFSLPLLLIHEFQI